MGHREDGKGFFGFLNAALPDTHDSCISDVQKSWDAEYPLGAILFEIGYSTAYATFLYIGFVKTVPKELEEAALLDGCNPYQSFSSCVSVACADQLDGSGSPYHVDME